MRFINKRLYLVLILLLPVLAWGQEGDPSEKPAANLLTPYDAIYTHLYYLQAEHYDASMAARPFYKRGEAGQDLALKLKQIWDGKGLRVSLSRIPEDPMYKDSVGQKNVYIPYPQELPEVYLERNKISGKWHYSRETERAIPQLHKEVYPFGSDLLLGLLPQLGQQRFMGLASWQYLGMLILIALSFILHAFISRLFRWTIHFLANSRLGKGHFDEKQVIRMAKVLSYLLMLYIVYTFVPVLQLPIGLSFYLLLLLKLTNTVLVAVLAMRSLAFFRSYLEWLTSQTKTTTDEYLLPIFIRIVNALIVAAAFIHALSVCGVNVTALLAGLSLGGLAVALAAQEALRNLLGSMMIYADRPFQIGDFVSVGSVTGTVTDIGFRSTRIKTMDTSVISVPNGNLMNETINNLGEREMRRFNTTIGLAYHTPPALIETFIQGLRRLHEVHPHTDKENVYIHLNNMGASSLDVLFMIYFKTNDWAQELAWKEELIFAILRLAEALGVQIAFPSTSVYVETMPGQGTVVPSYEEELKAAQARLDKFISKMKTDQ